VFTVNRDVFVFKGYSSLREVRLGPGAWRSAWLGEYNDFFL
jgi:hypothetical protein